MAGFWPTLKHRFWSSLVNLHISRVARCLEAVVWRLGLLGRQGAVRRRSNSDIGVNVGGSSTRAGDFTVLTDEEAATEDRV